MLQDLRVHTVASRHQYQHQQRQQHRRRLHRRQVTTMNYQHDRLFQRHYHHQTVKKKKKSFLDFQKILNFFFKKKTPQKSFLDRVHLNH